MTTDAKAWLLALMIMAGLTASIGFHYALGAYLHHGYPQNTFLIDPNDAFRDFVNIFAPVQAGSPYSEVASVYFPFAFLPFWLVRGVAAKLVFAAMLLALAAATSLWMWRNVQGLERYARLAATFVLAWLTYPVLFTVDRGNVEILVFAFLCVFLARYQIDDWKLATLALAAATAMKLYPAVFIVLFLARRQYAAVILTGVLTLALTLGSAALYPGGVRGSLALLQHNLGYFKDYFVIGRAGLHFNASLFGVIRIFTGGTHAIPHLAVDRLLLPYTIACLAGFAILSVFVLLRIRVFWQQVAVLSFIMILFPQVSFDYKLLHVLLPAGLFLAAAPRRHDLLYTVLFGLVLIPKAYYWIAGDVSVSVLLNPLLLVLIMGVIIWDSLRAETDGGELQARKSRSAPVPVAA